MAHDNSHIPEQVEFTEQQKQEILERDNYRCVICGHGETEGVELHVNHIKPKSKGGKAILKNGQTLCTEHYSVMKNETETDSGSQMFNQLYEQAKQEGNEELIAFYEELIGVYKKHGVNDHIDWTP